MICNFSDSLNISKFRYLNYIQYYELDVVARIEVIGKSGFWPRSITRWQSDCLNRCEVQEAEALSYWAPDFEPLIFLGATNES
jgi:hypothetical protein